MAERKFPLIDFNALVKGQVLGVPYLEKLFGVPYGTAKYNFRAEQLKSDIIRYAGLYPRTVKGAIEIMHDEAGAEYNFARQASLCGQIMTTVKRAALIDPSQLSEGSRRQHESNMRHGAAFALEAAKHAARKRLPSGD